MASSFIVPSAAPAAPPATPQPKGRRNQPETPSSETMVVLLSPRTLVATNRFFCEVCSKGFKREQNLQFHRRCHDLPWKQKSTVAAERKVYLCPEPTCFHHNPSRAFRDLNGIKKHFLRKHGEKNYNCDKCFKKYAIQSDLKAHCKKCGTTEYRCDSGTLFSRSSCNALAQEAVGINANIDGGGSAPSALRHVHHSRPHPLVAAMPPLSSAFRAPPPMVASSTFFMPLEDCRLKSVAAPPMHDHSGGSSSSASPSMFNLSYTFPNRSSNGGADSFDLFQFNNDNEFSNATAPPHMLATPLLQNGLQLGSSSTSTNVSLLRTFPSSAAPKLEHRPHFGMNGTYRPHQQVTSIQDFFASIQGPPLHYSSYPNVGPPPCFRSSSSDHGLTRNFLGMHAPTATEGSSGGGESFVNRKGGAGAVPPTNFNGAGGIQFN